MLLGKWINKYRKVVIALVGILIIVGGTLLALKFARGYRPRFGKTGPALSGTGLLVADSEPEGAQVFINGKLTTATDDTLNLSPGTYEVEIRKDGFIPWKKTLKIAAELVTQTTTKLFPSVPNLTPLTFTGAIEPIPSPDGRRIVYKVSSASTETKNGLWVLELTDRNLPIARASEPRQISRNTSMYNYLKGNVTWSPDSNEVLVFWLDEEESISEAVLLGANRFIDEQDILDVTSRLPVLLSQWSLELDLREQKRLTELPDQVLNIATQSAAVYFSPDEQRLMYVPGEEMTLSEQLIPDLPGESTQPEERDLKKDKIYVYDIKEDRNYLLPGIIGTGGSGDSLTKVSQSEQLKSETYWEDRLSGVASVSASASKQNVPLPPVPDDLVLNVIEGLNRRYSPISQLPVQWFPTSGHLIKVGKGEMSIMEYDGQNNSTVYAGPFAENFVYPWPNGSRLVILTNLTDESSPNNLYGINLN